MYDWTQRRKQHGRCTFTELLEFGLDLGARAILAISLDLYLYVKLNFACSCSLGSKEFQSAGRCSSSTAGSPKGLVPSCFDVHVCAPQRGRHSCKDNVKVVPNSPKRP